MQSQTKLRAGIIGVGLAFFILLEVLSRNPHIVEGYYSEGIYPLLAFVISNASSYVQLSITEFCLWFLLLFGVPFSINRIRKKRTPVIRVLLNILSFFSILFMWFYLFWGLNYFRMPLDVKLGLKDVKLQQAALDSALTDAIVMANALNVSYPVHSIAEINRMIQETYPGVLEKLGVPMVHGTSRIKTLAGNWLLNKTTTSGFFSPFFHEVHFNSDLLIFEQPFVIAHEKAHLMGFTNEAEANFLAYLVCINSSDALCRYSGYFSILGYFLNGVGGEEREVFYRQLHEGVLLDFDAVADRWRGHRGFLSTLAGEGYDVYLKANRIEEGSRNYSRVVGLVLRFIEKEKEQQTNSSSKD